MYKCNAQASNNTFTFNRTGSRLRIAPLGRAVVVTINTEPDAIDAKLSNVDTTNSKATSAETGDAKRNSTTSPNDFEKYKFYKKSTFRFGITW
jgi:hypothetical protein